jgi:subtilase family serine protease
VTLRNEGTASAGPSTLKVYQNTTSTPGGTLLYEQAVGALAPGQSTNISFVMSPRSTCSIHVYCKFIFVADANNVVVESDESDNIYVRSMLRAR